MMTSWLQEGLGGGVVWLGQDWKKDERLRRMKGEGYGVCCSAFTDTKSLRGSYKVWICIF